MKEVVHKLGVASLLRARSSASLTRLRAVPWVVISQRLGQADKVRNRCKSAHKSLCNTFFYMLAQAYMGY